MSNDDSELDALRSPFSWTPVLVAQLAWWLSWGLAQVVVQAGGPAWWPLTINAFTVGFVTLCGIGAALWAIQRLDLWPRGVPNRASTIVGVIAFLIALGLGLIGSGALAELPQVATPLIVARYVLLFAPMALSVVLQSFILVPQAVLRVCGRCTPLSGTVAVVAGGASCAVGFVFDQLFRSAALAGIEFMLAVPIIIGALATRSVAATFGVYFVVMVVNTLAEAKYVDYPWLPLILGFVSAVIVAGAHLTKSPTRHVKRHFVAPK